MILEIANVDHGACAVVSTSNGRRLMIDCGHHAKRGWYPGSALRSNGVDMLDRLVVTNFDEDHCSGIENLFQNVEVRALISNRTVSSFTLREIKSEHGMGRGIRALGTSMERLFTGGPTSPADDADFGDTSVRAYCNAYHPNPLHGFTDTNNLSLAVFATCGPHKVIFPGDLEVAGWRMLLQNPAFRNELEDVTLFVASHHGRLNGYCEDVLRLCPRIDAVIFSDEGIRFDSQQTAELYRRHARGISFDGRIRRVLTTRSDNSMRFELHSYGGGTAMLDVAA